MSIALSPASPRLESSYTSYNNRDPPARSTFSPDPEISQSSFERSAAAAISYPTVGSASTRADPAFRNQHEPLDRATRPEAGLAMERRRERSMSSEGAVIEHSGQDHDRIDVEMEDAVSEHFPAYVATEERVLEEQSVSEPEHQDVNDEMDTTPDASSSDDRDVPDLSVPPGDRTIEEAVPQAMGIALANLEGQNVNISSEPNTPQISQPAAEGSQSDAPVNTRSLSTTPPPQNPSMDPYPIPGTPPPPPANDNDSDDDSSMDDDDEHPYWANFQPDISAATEEELVAIKARTNDKSATDEAHWKSIIFEDLEDPEHIVGEDGKITWTLKGFHGTPTNPNKEKFLRSPQTKIGNLWWNVKVFPRGNDGTEYVSVYVECSNEPRDATTPIEEVTEEEAAQSKQAKRRVSWGSAAQIGCIMFNPNDPKVQYNAKSSHYFSNGNEDWGWVRFHGPWETIHRRQYEQTMPLLQNDSVEIVAYIRLVHDYTGSLWWHPPPQNQVDWDSVAKTGCRGMSSHFPHTSTLVAALAPWIHLRPFQYIIMNAPVPHVDDKAWIKPRPLIAALKSTLTNLKAPSRREDQERLVVSDNSVSIASIEDAFGWHAFDDVLKDDDVIGVWEALRHLLNIEWSKTPNIEPRSPDVLGFMLTLRQRMVFAENTHLDKLKIHNTQGILDDCIKGDSTVVPWDGFSSNKTQSSIVPPPFLQMELPRQVFDTETRKWKRSTHKIELDETIWLQHENQPIEYTMYGMIVHSGHLELANYYSIVRPRGPEAPWMQYGGATQGDVKLLTKKQAVDAHQGTGESGEGVEPIAYVVMYIRFDFLRDMLPDLETGLDSTVDHVQGLPSCTNEPNYKKQSYNPVGIINPWPKEPADLSVPETVAIHVFTPEILSDYGDRGFYDVWQLESKRAKVTIPDLPLCATIREVRERLVAEHNLAAIPEQCRLWLAVVAGTRSRWSLPLRQYKLDTTLQEIEGIRGTLTLWLHVTPLDSVPQALTQVPEVNAIPATASQTPPVLDASPDANVAASAVGSSGATAAYTGAATGLARLLDQIQSAPDESPSIMSLIRAANTITEDVPMGGTQDQPADTVSPRTEVPALGPPQTTLEDDSTMNDVYVLIKVFTAENQTLKSLGPFLVSRQDKIGEVLERLEVTKPKIAYEIFCDEGGEIQSGRLKTERTFEMEESRHGAVLVVQEKLSPDKMKEIKNRGDCPHVLEYYAHLINILDPCLAADKYTRSYFGTEYFSMSLKRGLPHGRCDRIDMNGDSYSGSFVFGEKQGAGMMKYANGDIYTGEWMEDLPSGQGKMVYGATGNVYEGGWKKGKRYGKGIMKYEVADEEEAICPICYDKEMDALLYRCGHVVACLDCARQVDICPVCRSSVEGVVRIYRTM